MKLNWESALLILLVLEILLFGAINPRMLDINMLLFSTSDFICIGIVALPLTLVDHWPVRHCAGRHDAGRLANVCVYPADPAAGSVVRPG